MRRGAKHGNGGNYRKRCEDYETNSIDDHGSKFPVAHHLRILLRLLHASGDEAELAQDGLEVTLSQGTGRGDVRVHSKIGSAHANVIVHVKDIGEEGLGRAFLDILQRFHLLVHSQRFPRDFLPWTAHLEHPRKPLQEQCLHL